MLKETEDYIQFKKVSDITYWKPYFGRYAAFGGKGIIDGLRDTPYKNECYKIIGISKDKLFLKKYRSPILLRLDDIHWDQEIRIYTKYGFSKLKPHSNETFVKGL